MTTKNVIAFRNKMIVLPKGKGDALVAMSVISELMQFGFVPSEDARTMLENTPVEALIQFHDEVSAYLKDMTGAKHSYRPFWKGFPQQVMEKSEYELWLHQIAHYWSNGTYAPSDWTRTRPTAFEQPSYTTYKAGTEDEFKAIFTNLVSVNQSLTPQDLNDVKWFAANVRDLPMPEVIPFKETLTTLASLGLDVPVKTVTDVLRIAVAMSGGDVSLPKVPTVRKIAKNRRTWGGDQTTLADRNKFKFRKFNRAERQYILSLLEKTNCDVTEAVLKDQRWIRLGEILHPGEYRRKFPKSFKMFMDLRNSRIQSWYGEVDKAMSQSPELGVAKLAERPGEFMRKLDWLVRTGKGDALSLLPKVGSRVSNKVLFETYAHFEKRDKSVHNRTVMVKGARKRTKLPDLPALPTSVVEQIQKSISSALTNKFAKLEPLGKTYISEELKKIPVPANMRSLGDSLVPTVRGERKPIGNQNAKVIRAYVHWYDSTGREDLDLSTTFLGMGKIEHISWSTNIRHPLGIGCHSGDVRHQRGACAEYVDIDIKKSLQLGFKYVVMSIHNYNGRGLNTMQDCVFGYMEREYPEANEIFKPATIANALKLQSTSTNTLVAVIDIETQEYIFLDIDTAGIPVATHNVSEILEAIKPYCEPPKFSVYDLLLMHVKARGELVASEAEAETVFNYEPFAESYVETLRYMGV